MQLNGLVQERLSRGTSPGNRRR